MVSEDSTSRVIVFPVRAARRAHVSMATSREAGSRWDDSNPSRDRKSSVEVAGTDARWGRLTLDEDLHGDTLDRE